MDKSYMMGHSFGKTGLFHHWSPISDYSSETRRKISDQLPVPNGLKIGIEDPDDTDDEKSFSVSVKFVPEETKITKLFEEYSTSRNGDNSFRLIKDILVEFDKTHSFELQQDIQQDETKIKILRKLIYTLNKHNMHVIGEEEAKNIAIDSIIDVCRDFRNVQSAHTPIDTATSRLKKLLSDLEAGNIGDENDGLSIFQLQEDNQTGKKVVGVMANALKAFLTITQYFNNYYSSHKNISDSDIPYFLNQITINNKVYSMSSVANSQMEEEQLKVLKNALLKYTKVPSEILKTNDDVSIILSAMVTLATDNAKELALAKLHASLNLASMHTYLISMGVPFNEVVDYTAKSKIFTDLYNLTKADSWSGLKGKLTSSVWKQLQENAKQFTKAQIENKQGYTLDDVEQLKRLHNWAFEFRVLTQLLGINQGMKSGLAQAVSFKLQFENIIQSISDRISVSSSLKGIIEKVEPTDPKKLPSYEDIDTIIKSHGLNPTQELRQKYLNKIKDFVNKYGDISHPIKISMNDYFTNPEYRQMVVELYDIYKSSINIFDVINHSPNFFEMLSSLNDTVQKVSKGAKGEFIFTQLTKLWNRKLIEEQLDVPYIIDEAAIKDAQSFFDDYVISDFILNTVSKEYSFSYKVYPNQSSGIVKTVDFSEIKGLNDFQEAFNIMIARLKRLHKNDFTKSLISYERKDGKILYKLNFNLDALNKDQAGEQQLKYIQIVGGFNNLKDIKISDLLNDYKGNPDMTVGDMFYLYNLIFNLGQRGQNTLTSLLDSYVSQSGKNSLIVKYLSSVLAFDLKKVSIKVDPKRFNYHIFKRYLYRNQSLNINGTNFDPKKIILTNIGKVEEHKKLQNTYQRFLEAYRQGKLIIEMDLNCN